MANYYNYGHIDELRKKRKRRKVRIAFLIIVSMILSAAGLVYSLFFSGWFSIRQVQISGNKEIPEGKLRSLANEYIQKHYFLNIVQPFSNILFASSESLERSMRERFAIIETVKVNKDLFRRNLKIEIKERTGVGIYCRQGRETCFYFDKEGVFFKESPRFSGQLFLAIEDGRNRNFNLGDVFDDKELLEKVNLTKNILDELKLVDYSNFFLPENSFEFWIKTREGWYIYLDKETDAATQLVALKKVLEEKIPPVRRPALQYIDLRINNRIYYK